MIEQLSLDTLDRQWVAGEPEAFRKGMFVRINTNAYVGDTKDGIVVSRDRFGWIARFAKSKGGHTEYYVSGNDKINVIAYA